MKINKLITTLLIGLFFMTQGWTQNTVEGYVFEAKNRGYLNQAKVYLLDPITKQEHSSTFSNKEGFYTLEAPGSGEYLIIAQKANFIDFDDVIEVDGNEEKTFVKIKMDRQPGYLFEATLAPVRFSEDIQVDAIKGARIEVFNNTIDMQELELKEHPEPEFKFPLKEGNHYTLMIRKEGYLTKRIEAYVDIEGCILCLDGVGDLQPGVTENLSDENKLGVLLANIELEPVKVGTKFEVENIYYDFDKSYIRSDAARELNDLAVILKDNPKLIVELGSHTDARGKDEYNMKLSDARAKSAVLYLIQRGVDSERITAKGYGESQLANDCHNGVECEEEMHQENRRTVIKVTGIRAFDELAQKTLAQIIREEKFLSQAFGGEQIIIAPNEELPLDLQEYIEENQDELSSKELKQIKELDSGQRSLYEPLSDDFSGYSVFLTNEVSELVLLRSSIKLDDKIYEYKDGENQLYLIGEYRKMKKAKKRLEKLKPYLPKAEIVFFKAGKLIKS